MKEQNKLKNKKLKVWKKPKLEVLHKKLTQSGVTPAYDEATEFPVDGSA
jgi:hypothetical protein